MRLAISIILLAVPVLPVTAYADWQRLETGSSVSAAKSVVMDKDNPGTLYAGFEAGLYKSVDNGESWKLLAPGLIDKINFLSIDRDDSRVIYAAAQNGLFRSPDAGESWQKIFSGKDAWESDCLTLAICYAAPKTIFIGSASGVFFSPANRIFWQKVSGRLSEAIVKTLIVDLNNPEGILGVSSRGFFKSPTRLSSYEMSYGGFNPESEDSISDLNSPEEEIPPQDIFLRSLAIDPKDTLKFYLASQKGVILSLDSGSSWQKEIFTGLFEEKINYILLPDEDSRIFLATENGVFECALGSCKQLYPGMSFKQCNQLARDNRGNIYAATDRGLFRMAPKKEEHKAAEAGAIESQPMAGRPAESYDRRPVSYNEPVILEIQKAAIKYAEVAPEKISYWRKQARLKALLPELTLDYDKTVTTALGAGYDRVQVGPRDWGLTLKWNIADLVFSSDQTSIDVRSRLMVQLRDDILNEVTRLYFERKRLRQELNTGENLSPKTKAEKELRLEELTASIDGLTGGYFSRNLKVANNNM